MRSQIPIQGICKATRKGSFKAAYAGAACRRSHRRCVQALSQALRAGALAGAHSGTRASSFAGAARRFCVCCVLHVDALAGACSGFRQVAYTRVFEKLDCLGLQDIHARVACRRSCMRSFKYSSKFVFASAASKSCILFAPRSCLASALSGSH